MPEKRPENVVYGGWGSQRQMFADMKPLVFFLLLVYLTQRHRAREGME